MVSNNRRDFIIKLASASAAIAAGGGTFSLWRGREQ
jgi:hypothetical protein